MSRQVNNPCILFKGTAVLRCCMASPFTIKFCVLIAVGIVLVGCVSEDQFRASKKCYSGDGVFTDYGEYASLNRFVVNFGILSLTKTGEVSFTVGGLPEARYTAGILLQTPFSLDICQTTNRLTIPWGRARVAMILKERNGKTVLNVSGYLSEYGIGNDGPEQDLVFLTGYF
jgi:hypothetical protein